MLPEPRRGGFGRPFGAAQFILDFLAGRGPVYGVDAIDPGQGAPQTDVHAAYNRAVLLVVARDRANLKEERAARRQRRNLDLERIEELTRRYIEKPPRLYARMRYHSFLSYFAKLKALGWVEPSGESEPSLLQDTFADAPPRIYYRLTTTGLSAPATNPRAVRDPLGALYGREG
ncbi:MAG: hypothetical protein HY531_02795 [Chloroflexi bacterium]|nr:hypothetical protein [Chloroflexota bacterium]